MPSFDIISEADLVEVKNAVENATRELQTRFDFRGVEASIKFEKDTAKLSTESDFQLTQLRDILRNNLVKRKVDARSMDLQDVDRVGKSFNQTIAFRTGVDQPTAKKVVKLIKDNKMKVQVAIQGEQLRVTGKKRDDLQAAMQLVKSADELNIPFQFTNFKD